MAMGSASAAKGTKWTSTVYFDPLAKGNVRMSYILTNDVLLSTLPDFVGVNDKIKQVTVYKVPFTTWQITDFLFYHNFVLLETTDNWWWTIEKNSEGITIQRGDRRDYVKDFYRRKLRYSRIERVVADSGRRTVMQLIKWLHDEDELHKKYNYLWSNCKHFAKRVFDEVAKTKEF